MPLYEYRCENCEKVTEVMQKFSDAPLSTCPDCQGPVQKIMSLSSFSLKGSGWYSTDYKKSSSPASSSNSQTSADQAASGPSDSGSTHSSEGKKEGASSAGSTPAAAASAPAPSPKPSSDKT